MALIFLISFVNCTYYYYKMPFKMQVWDRQNSLITFPGSLWNPNIIMPIESVNFAYSDPNESGTGAFELGIARPERITTYFRPHMAGDCYLALSLLLWYMDRNRPLPPGTAFDPYRQKDFERRKAEGVPEPLFPSRIPTPEATPAQQAERERIGGW